MKFKKTIVSLLLLAALVCGLFCLSGCGKKGEPDYTVTDRVRIEMENGGIIDIELYGEIAPITVANFLKLVNEGFYDGLTFHRVIQGFMIQCGDPTGTGLGEADETIKGEFALNGFDNPISHVRGVVSMGRKGNGYNTASSHFFICHADKPSLDGRYAAFGRVYAGMEVVDAIAVTPTDSNDKPLVDQVIRCITVLP